MTKEEQTKLTVEDINILLQICANFTVRVDQATPVLLIVQKLNKMTKELQK